MSSHFLEENVLHVKAWDIEFSNLRNNDCLYHALGQQYVYLIVKYTSGLISNYVKIYYYYSSALATRTESTEGFQAVDAR